MKHFKRMIRLSRLIAFVIMGSLAGCASQQARMMKSFDKAGEDVYVRFERTECFGTCPVYELTIRGNRQLEYTGKSFAKPKGTFTVTISEEDWANLRAKIIDVGFFNFEDEYDAPISDVPSSITEVFISEKRNKTVVNRWDAPEKLVALETFIDQLWQSYVVETK